MSKAKWQRVRIDLPAGYKPSERIAIGQKIVDYIVERSQKGKDKNNKKFPGYTKEYVKSLDFKNAGKGKKVDLTLSGDMLASLEVLSQKKGSILIGFKNGTEENDRAEGNILGTYGQSNPLPGKKRDFLGITNKDKLDILKEFPLKDDKQRALETAKILASIKGAKEIT